MITQKKAKGNSMGNSNSMFSYIFYPISIRLDLTSSSPDCDEARWHHPAPDVNLPVLSASRRRCHQVHDLLQRRRRVPRLQVLAQAHYNLAQHIPLYELIHSFPFFLSFFLFLSFLLLFLYFAV
jgi:hypothetical protein